MANYVKFRRGTPEAFKVLLDNKQAELDTLYFIYEENETTGELYLGSKLIAGGKAIEGATNLNDLLDVVLTETKTDDCLIYDISGQWVNKPIRDVLPIFVGTIGETDGVAGLVPAPTASQNNMFLRSDGKWVEIVIDSAETDNVSLEKVDGVLSVAGFKDAPEGAQPIKNEDGSLSWIKPDLTAIETLQNDVKNIEQILNPTDDEGNPVEGGLASDVKDLKENVGEPAKYDEEGTLIAAATGLHAELDKKANAAEIEEALNSKADIIEVNEALGLKADSAVVEEALGLKANIADVYTKTEADSAIATAIANADHLSREIVSILPDVANADSNIIYMVPSGLQEDDNKYYEWILIDGIFEQVGSWEVDLKAYAKVAEVEEALNGKVDKDGDSRLMTQSEGAKLASIEENAEKNIINSISADFEILSDDTHDRELILKPIAITKITGLEDRLNNKVDKEAGWTLLSPTDQEKLARLSVDDNGEIGISASVSVEKVQGLEDWLNKNADVLPGLSQNNFNDTFKQKLEQQLLIKSVETTQLDVADGHLSIKAVEMNKVVGLNDILALKASVEQVNTLSTTVGSLQQSLNDYNARVNTIEDRLTWHGLT